MKTDELGLTAVSAGYPNDEELMSIADARVSEINGEVIAESTQKFKNVGDYVEGIFIGLDYQEGKDKDGRPRGFQMGAFQSRDGSIQKCYLNAAAVDFIHTYAFPVGQYLRIEYIGAQPLSGARSPMKQFKYSFSKKLQLSAGDKYLSPQEMALLIKPKSARSRLLDLNKGVSGQAPPFAA